jgi:hypothetical protein
MLSVCMCARFQSNSKECYLIAINRIFWYLVHTPNLGLWYAKGSTFTLLSYSDSDYASCRVERKSTSRTCQFLGRSLVSWSSKKQNSIALSTAEAKYVAANACCAQLLWMKQTLRDFGSVQSKIPLLCDNESAIKLVDNPVNHSRTLARFELETWVLRVGSCDLRLEHFDSSSSRFGLCLLLLGS